MIKKIEKTNVKKVIILLMLLLAFKFFPETTKKAIEWGMQTYANLLEKSLVHQLGSAQDAFSEYMDTVIDDGGATGT
ncbi:hypothetical protein IPJ72_07130 [Candidatus Peregrinibacteria bacterium]|nr:MAG: hypothetical protein IPJ72_07130 [Candidatus Peregrinibacteria bacterium]